MFSTKPKSIFSSKKGEMMGILYNILMVFVLIIALFYIVGSLASTFISSFGQVSNSGLPLANLFTPSGVLATIFMIALFVIVLVVLLKQIKGAHK